MITGINWQMEGKRPRKGSDLWCPWRVIIQWYPTSIYTLSGGGWFTGQLKHSHSSC